MMPPMLTKAQVLMPYLGQKIVLTEPLDDGVFLYPMGSVGVLDAFQFRGPDKVVAVVIFENCPVQDCMDVEVDDLMPLEFLWEGYELKKVEVRKSIYVRIDELKKRLKNK